MTDLEIITTADGSHSLRNRALSETYHSQHGAVQESLHVFITNGFKHVVEHYTGSINIFEVGFGTGLNAWLTLKANELYRRNVHYTSIDSRPLSKELWSKLNYVSEVEYDGFAKLHQSAWDAAVTINPQFTLEKRHITLQDIKLAPNAYQLVYFDAFAPAKQPEMWSLDMLRKVVTAVSPSGIFVTYCAKGQLKRDLKALGLSVETLAGPPGKKEMVRAKRV